MEILILKYIFFKINIFKNIESINKKFFISFIIKVLFMIKYNYFRI